MRLLCHTFILCCCVALLDPSVAPCHASTQALGPDTGSLVYAGEAPDSTAHATFLIPPEGNIPLAIVIDKDAEVLDFCGPLEVFTNAWTADGHPVFKPYIVAKSHDPVTVGGGMRIVPDSTFAEAPRPRVVVIPAMGEPPAEMVRWIASVGSHTDVTMSVCNGAFVLAKTGLLDGKPATSHHSGYFRFAGMFPRVHLVRGARYVESGNLASAGGISSGIDLALRVVERYVGREATLGIIEAMEYQGTGWERPMSNEAFARLPASNASAPVCPLCRMAADTTIHSRYRGRMYYFCSTDEKEFFDNHLEVMERFLAEDAALRPEGAH